MLNNNEKVNVVSTIGFKNMVNNFVNWLNNISWGKFVLFVLFVTIGKSIVENVLGVQESTFIDNVASIFIFVSFGVKFFQKPRINVNKINHHQT